MTLGCEKSVIKVGVVTTLSGNNSDIGVAMRDGILLKVNQINAEGGIDGHLIELIINDDKGDLDSVRSITDNLIEQGVQILYGYETSNKKDAIEDLFDQEDLLFISPTLSAYELSDIDDNFFRVIPTNYQQGTTLGNYSKQFSSKTLILYSEANKNFARGVYEGYEEAFDGEVLIRGINKDILALDDQILSWYEGMDSLMVVMNPNDTLLTSQIFYREGIETNIYSSNWGMAANAYQAGGESIQGTVFVSLLGDESYQPYKAFKETYFNEYHEEPAFAAIYAYEAGTLLTEALSISKSFEASDIKEALLKLETIEGVISDLAFTEYGDILRANQIVKLIDGNFIYQK
jgi:branched-chain amino acid transport system substrate-binding protein